MKKRIITISVLVLVLVLALFAFTACNSNDVNVGDQLINNGNFEKFDSDVKTFEGWKWSNDWTKSNYGSQTLTTTEIENNKDQLGEKYLYITNDSASNVYLYQTVKIDRKKIYEISVDVKITSNIIKGTGDKGAFVSFLENTEYYFVETSSLTEGWKTLTFYVKPMNTDYLTVCLSLGAENQTSKGTAFFDNLSMKKVDDVKTGYNVTEFRKSKIARYEKNVDGVAFVVLMSLFTIAVLGLGYVLIRRNYSSPKAFVDFDGYVPTNNKSKNKGTTIGKNNGKNKAKVNHVAIVTSKELWKNKWFIVSMLALGTFLIRLIFLVTMHGFGAEMNFMVNLANLMGQNGAVVGAYAKYATSLVGISPGTLYILSILGAMGKGLTTSGMSILIRMVGVLGDIAVVCMIYFYGKKYVGNKISTIFAGMYAALPIVFVMSGLNATFVSVLVALMLGVVILLVEKKYLPMIVVFVLAAVLDIRAFALLPIIIAYMAYMFYRDDEKRLKVTKNRAIMVCGLLGGFVLLYLLTLPVAINQIGSGQPFHNFTILANMMTKNTLFVENAMNLYGMVGMNMKGVSRTVSILNILFIIVLEMYAVSLYLKNRNKQEVLLIASFTLAVIAVFTLKVDFTYLFLALALGLIYTMISGDKRMYLVMGSYSLLTFLSIGQLASNSGFIAVLSKGFFVNFETTGADYIIFCVLTVITTLYFAYVTYSITNNNKIVDIKPMMDKFPTYVKKYFDNFVLKIKVSKASRIK